MIKRFLTFLAVFSVLFSFPVCAESSVSLKPEGDFFVYGEDTNTVSEILGMNLSDLQKFCEENDILYLAVNKDNSKQIRISKSLNDFSDNIVNLTNLSDEKIKSLIPDIVGLSDASGDIVNLKGQKAVKINLKSTDSGGDFILTQYYTVANKENYTISFYTNISHNTDYINKVLETLECSDFLSEKNSSGNWHYIFLGAAAIFGLATIFIIFTIIHDIRRERVYENSDNEIIFTDSDTDEIISDKNRS